MLRTLSLTGLRDSLLGSEVKSSFPGQTPRMGYTQRDWWWEKALVHPCFPIRDVRACVHVCVCVCVRERERERDRQRDRERQRERQRETER